MELKNSRIAQFKKREKRFTVFWTDGTNGYCPNPGKMADLLESNCDCLITPIATKSKWRWEAAFIQGTWVGVNTHSPNQIMKNYLHNLFPNEEFKSEVSFGQYRADFASDNKVIEVKNVHWKVDNIARFPDCVTVRGARQMLDLTELQKTGKKCYVIYVVQRSDIKQMGVADWIDKNYDANTKIAKQSGVKFLGFSCNIDENNVNIKEQIEFIN